MPDFALPLAGTTYWRRETRVKPTLESYFDPARFAWSGNSKRSSGFVSDHILRVDQPGRLGPVIDHFLGMILVTRCVRLSRQ